MAQVLPLIIAGPTAAGKSELALLLAERISGELISVDSMQVYRGMDIGTAKATPAERARVPHHLIDVVEINEPFDAARFAALAKETIEQLQERKRVPILCGGTGLYFKALLEGVGSAPASDPVLRAELERTPLHELLAELSRNDPETYARIDQKNPRRIVRAVEVVRLTGRPFSEQRSVWKSGEQWPAFVISRRAADLHRRIDARVDEMFKRGLVNETRKLLEAGLAENKTAMQALGYRQVVEHLRGERSLEDTINLVKLRTRQFAKRQLTWFRHQMSAEWMVIPPEANTEDVVGKILEAYEKGKSS